MRYAYVTYLLALLALVLWALIFLLTPPGDMVSAIGLVCSAFLVVVARLDAIDERSEAQA